MIQRYEAIGMSPLGGLIKKDDGLLVLYSDHQPILAERDAEIAGLKSALQNQMQCVSELKEHLHDAKLKIFLLEKEYFHLINSCGERC